MKRALPLLLLLGGCQAQPEAVGDYIRMQDKIEMETHPVGRYVPLRTQEVAEGVDVLFLDTSQGRVCSQFLTNNAKLMPDTLTPACWHPAPEAP